MGVETVRFYERKGLIRQPPRPPYGFRTYPAETVQHIRFIRQAQELGFSLKDIQELLALRADAGSDCADVRARATAKLDDVRHKIKQLKRIEKALGRLVDTCPGSGGLDGCTILEAIEESKARRP